MTAPLENLIKYHVHCDVEDADYTTDFIPESEGAKCPVDAAHAISNVSRAETRYATAVIDDKGRQRIYAETRVRTYGRFSARGLAFDAPGPAGTITKHWVKFPFSVDMADGGIFIESNMKGDVASLVGPMIELNALVSMDVLAAAISASDKQVTFIPALMPTFLDNAIIDEGYFELYVDDGVNNEGPYLVTGYDRATGVVTLDLDKSWTGEINAEPADWGGFTNGYATTAVVKIRRVFVCNQEIDGGEGFVKFAADSAGSAPLPAGTPICMEYTNVDGAATKRVRWSLSLLTGKVETP